MVVFLFFRKVIFYVLCFIFFTLATLLIILISSIKIDLKNLEIYISNFEKLCNIIENILEYTDNKKILYSKLSNFFSINIKIKIMLFNVIPIFNITINNNKIMKKIAKNAEKKNKSKIKSETKKELIKAFLYNLKINNLEIKNSIGIKDAKTTALSVGVINIIYTTLINYLYNNKNYYKNENKNINYIVDPKYSTDFFLKLKINSKAKIMIFSLLRYHYYKNKKV